MEWLNKLTPQQRAIADKVAVEADRQGVPRELALAAAMQESSFKPQAKSKTGPVGVMMLSRAAAKEQGVNRYNLDQNIRGGVGYLKQNLAQQLASAMDDDEPPFEVATKTPVNTNTPAQEDDDGDDEADEMIRRIRARRAARGE